jgi:ATP-dependent exoDNAse (exonuclease V) alpha subunit
MAPSWVAANELRKSTGIPAVAIAKWLYDRKQGTALPLDDRTVLIVDEASMIGTRDMAAILVAARDAKAKVLLVGDQRQLEAVGAGGPLRIVADALDRETTLEQVRRQQIAWQREASIAMAKGDIVTGVQAYIDRGAMETAEGRDATLTQSILAWTELRQRHGQDTLLMTRRNRDVAELNRQARFVLKGEGQLTGEEIMLPSINREGKVVGISLAIGDRLRFGQSHPTFGFRNGTLLTVEGLRLIHDDVVVTFKTADGQLIKTDWRELSPTYRGRTQPPRIAHAYASTVNGAQGRTVAAAVYAVVIEPDTRELYVGLTRHAQDAKIVIDKSLLGSGLSFQHAQEIYAENRLHSKLTTRWKPNIIDFNDVHR